MTANSITFWRREQPLLADQTPPNSGIGRYFDGGFDCFQPLRLSFPENTAKPFPTFL
jgi:hypothetical protein